MDESTSEPMKIEEGASHEPASSKPRLLVIGICSCVSLFVAGIVKQNWVTICDRWCEYQKERHTLRGHLPGYPTLAGLSSFLHTGQDSREIHERFGIPLDCETQPNGGTMETYLFDCPRHYRCENVVGGFWVWLDGSKVVGWKPIIMSSSGN